MRDAAYWWMSGGSGYWGREGFVRVVFGVWLAVRGDGTGLSGLRQFRLGVCAGPCGLLRLVANAHGPVDVVGSSLLPQRARNPLCGTGFEAYKSTM